MKRFPSITTQTPWKAWIVNFGRALEDSSRPRFFNPSLICHDGHDWLVTRKAENVDETGLGMNSIWAFQLGENGHPSMGLKVALRGYINQHFEDPRITRVNGGLWLSYCTFAIEKDRKWYGAHQSCAELGHDFQPINQYDPVYGGNGGSVMQNTGDEKNWLWFDHDGQLMCVYMTEPHIVLEWTHGIPELKNRWDTGADPFHKWSVKFGHARGGTPPVRVDNLYWSFFHSSIDNGAPNGKRRYLMGAYAFDAEPPFNVRWITNRPLLVASEEDPWAPTQPLVVFPCGAILRSNKWLISLGINDMASALMEIPHEDIEKKVSRHDPPKPPPPIRFLQDKPPVQKRPIKRHIRRRKSRQAGVAGSDGHIAG